MSWITALRRARRAGTLGFVGVAMALSAATTQAQNEKHACRPEDKLIGRIALSTSDTPGTWWHLTRVGLESAGIVGDAAQLNTMQIWFGIGFNTLAEAVVHLVNNVKPLDQNGNGFVCAYSLRGTRTSFGDPDYAKYSFFVMDDR